MKYKKPWWKNVRRWGQTNLTEDDPRDCDIGFWREHWKQTKVQGVIVNAAGIVAYYPSKYGLQYRAKYLGDKDFFGEFVKAAREEGLCVVARMDINRCTEEFFCAHPDWFCRNIDGKPVMANGRYFSCVASGYYKEFIPMILREIIERYQPDGFTDNSWSGLGRNRICYCENCKEQFREYNGMELPVKLDWNDDAYREWVRWGMKVRIENWDLFNKVTGEAGGEDCLWSGMLHADPTHAGGSLRDLAALCARAKIIFTDHQSRDELNGFEQNALNGSLLRMASSDENTLAPESIANYVRGKCAFRLGANPAAESRMWLIDGMSGGISPWFHYIGGGQRDARRFDTPIPVFQWHAQNEEYLYNRTDIANIGLVWSQENADFFGRDRVNDRVAYPWRGFHRALVRGRQPFLPVNACDIPRDIKRLRTIILPNIAILDDSARDAVIAFVKGGGGLIVTGHTDFADKDGNLGGISKLLEAFGVKAGGPVIGSASRGNVNIVNVNYETHTYLGLPGERHPVLGGFEKTAMIPFGGGVVPVKESKYLKQIAHYIPAFPMYPPEFSFIEEECPDTGTVFAGEIPGGGRVVYFAANIDYCCGEASLPDHAQLLANAVRWTQNGSAPLCVEGPGYLDCRVYEQGGRRLVHIVNLSGANVPGYLEETLPVGPLKVTVAVGDAEPKAARLCVEGGEAPVEVKDGKAYVTLERVDAHELIVLE